MTTMPPTEAARIIRKFVAAHQRGMIPSGTMLDRCVRWFLWLAGGFCIIRDQHERLIPLRPNRVQLVLIATILMQAAKNRPIRIKGLKSRKQGFTTLVCSLKEFLCAHYPNQHAPMLAHRADDTKLIFEISKRIAQNYTAMPHRRIVERSIRYSVTMSHSWCATAGGKSVGAGGTPSFLHRSEVALWPQNNDDTDAASINAVPNVPTSVIIDESTARGRERFWASWDKARNGQGEYEALFFPWFLDDRLIAPILGDYGAYDEEERAVMLIANDYGVELSNEQFEWRHNKIAEVGPRLFKQEYPATPAEAVEAAKGLVLAGLRECVVDQLPFSQAPLNACVGGIDYGHGDPTSIVDGYWLDYVLYLDHIWRKVGTVADDRVRGLTEGHTYYDDPSARESRAELQKSCREHGVQVTIHPAPRTRGARESDYVTSEWERVIKLIREGRLKIHRGIPQLDQLLIEADNLFWDEKTGQPHKIRGEAWGHFDTLDALRYCVMGCTRVVKASQPRAQAVEAPRAGMRRW